MTTATTSASLDSGRVEHGYGAIATAFVAFTVYVLALCNGFAFDDVVQIPRNPLVTDGRIRELLLSPYWSDTALALYRPLTSLTFAFDWALAPDNAAWFHFTNVLWHVLASVLAYQLLVRFFQPLPALLGGLLFAVHPVHVEAVANVVGRAEPIAACFGFAACLAWREEARLRRTTRAFVVGLCFAMALFAKESAVMLPALLLLVDFADGAIGRDYIKRRWFEYVVLGVILAVYVLIRWRVVGSLTPTRVDPSLEVVTSVSDRVLTALQAWPIQARLLLLPTTLLADYGPRILLPISEWTPQATLGLTLVAAAVIGGTVAVLRKARLPALVLWWFPITILPVANFFFPIGVLVAERTLYLPSFAVSLLIALIASQPPVLAWRRARLGFALVMLALAGRALIRIPDWRTTDTILTAQVRSRPDSFRGQWHMARIARAKGDTDTALETYARALTLWPYREGLVNEAAAYAGSQRRIAWAQRAAKFGSERWPENVNFHRMLAAYALDLGDTVTARRAVAKGLSVDPADTTLNTMARVLGETVHGNE